MKLEFFEKNLRLIFFSVTIIIGIILTMGILPTYAAEETTYTGWLSIIWGDSHNGEAIAPRYILSVPDEESEIQLIFDEKADISAGSLLALDRTQVRVSGTASLSGQGEKTILEITEITSAALTGNDLQAASVTGSQPFISIMCKFSDYAIEPKNLSFFQNMYANSYPGMDHYWREVSYNTINVVGSGAVGWFTLPHTEEDYNPTDTQGGTDLYTLANDCLDKAESSVNFTQYKGINMMFNTDFDNGYAWGGSLYMTLDGVTKAWTLTWEPPWGYSNITVISHEMGHAFGLPHSSGAYGQTYDNQWDVMSDTWSNCINSSDPTYGCLGQHTISYHKDRLGWIPANQKYTVNDQNYASVTLEQLSLPQTSNYKMVQIPINDSGSHFYTVEVRRKTGYDVKLPGQAVIIHEVDLSRSRPANVIDGDGNGNTGDAGAMWAVGETFVDATNNIEISVTAATATGFEVKVLNDAIPPPENFHVTGSSQYSISLAWDDNSNETGYKLYRNTNGSFVEIANLSANTTSYTDQDVGCNTSYDYKLSAYTTSRESELTNTVTGSTSSTCPPIPDNDDFDYAEDVTSPSATSPLDTREATSDPDDPDLAGCNITGNGQATVWYLYHADSNTAVSLDTRQADYDTFIAVWTGSRNNLSLVACNDDVDNGKQSAVAFQVITGTNYYIEVGEP